MFGTLTALARLPLNFNAEENQIMKLKLATLVVASAVALSSVSASARVYRHSHYRNPYNSMNMMQAPAYAPSYGSSYGPAYPHGYSVPGDSNLSGTGSSLFGGGAADGAGGGGGGGP